MRLLFIPVTVLIFCMACKESDRKRYGRPDNQLASFFLNDSVQLEYHLEIDTAWPSVDFYGKARDFAQRLTFQYPGIVYLDGQLLTFSSVGGTIQSRIDKNADSLVGSHDLKIMFSDNMYFDWNRNELVSKNRDSLLVKFDFSFFQMLPKPVIRNDSIIFRTDKPVNDQVVNLNVVPLRNDDSPVEGSNGYFSELKVIDGNIAVPLSKFRKPPFNHYFVDFYFSRTYLLQSKGKEKGKFSIHFRVFPIRIKI